MLLAELGVGAAAAGQVVLAELTALPGWVTHLRSRAAADPPAAPDELVAYLAVRLGVEALVVGREVGLDAGGAPVPDPSGDRGSIGGESSRVRAVAALAHVGGRSDAEAVAAAATVLETLAPGARQLVWLEAAEAAFRRQLLSSLPPAVDQADDQGDDGAGRPRGLAGGPRRRSSAASTCGPRACDGTWNGCTDGRRSASPASSPSPSASTARTRRSRPLDAP